MHSFIIGPDICGLDSNSRFEALLERALRRPPEKPEETGAEDLLQDLHERWTNARSEEAE